MAKYVNFVKRKWKKSLIVTKQVEYYNLPVVLILCKDIKRIKVELGVKNIFQGYYFDPHLKKNYEVLLCCRT